MLIEQIIKIERLEGLGPLIEHVLLNWLFLSQKKFFKEDLRVDFYLQLKYCRTQCILLPPTRAKSFAKYNSKMQDFKRVWGLNCN